MNQVLNISRIAKLVKDLKKKRQKIVLAGGCFDLLHPGHIIFLDKAKKTGDILIVFLESDEKVSLLKGSNRPVYKQAERAQMLSALRSVDYVVKLPFIKDDAGYDEIINNIKPDIIAATKSNMNNNFFKRSAKLVGAKLKYVTKILGGYSTTASLTGLITVQ